MFRSILFRKMFKSIPILLCVSWLAIETLAELAPFIQKCEWNDKACLIKSSQIAVPFFASGVPDLGLPHLDPLAVKPVSINEGGLNLLLKDIVVTGAKNCQFIDVERNIVDRWIKFTCECPIDAHGNYVASGKLLVLPVEGNGPFHVQTDKLRFSVTHGIDMVDGKDGQKHWKFIKKDHTFEFIDKTLLRFENLFNGNQEKAAPVLNILDQNWKQLVQIYAKDIVAEVIKEIDIVIDIFLEAVPASELEK